MGTPVSSECNHTIGRIISRSELWNAQANTPLNNGRLSIEKMADKNCILVEVTAKNRLMCDYFRSPPSERKWSHITQFVSVIDIGCESYIATQILR